MEYIAKNKLDNCTGCSYELKYHEQKVVQTCELGIAGLYHRECYDKAKVEKINALQDL